MKFSEIKNRIRISLTLDYSSWLDVDFIIEECEEYEEWDACTDDEKKKEFLCQASEMFKAELEKILNEGGE